MWCAVMCAAPRPASVPSAANAAIAAGSASASAATGSNPGRTVPGATGVRPPTDTARVTATSTAIAGYDDLPGKSVVGGPPVAVSPRQGVKPADHMSARSSRKASLESQGSSPEPSSSESEPPPSEKSRGLCGGRERRGAAACLPPASGCPATAIRGCARGLGCQTQASAAAHAPVQSPGPSAGRHSPRATCP